MVAVMRIFLLTGLLASTILPALALPAPDSPAVRPAGGYALAYAADPANPLDMTCEALPGYGVFWVIISASNPLKCGPAPSCSEDWAIHKDKATAAWRTNTGGSGHMLVCAADQVKYPAYSGFPTKATYNSVSVDEQAVTDVTYVVHVIDLATGQTFYARPDAPPEPSCQGVLLYGWDTPVLENIKGYLMAGGMNPNDIVVQYSGVPGTVYETTLREALEARYDQTGQGFCTILFDSETIGPSGNNWGGLSPEDEQALQVEMLNGTGLVYMEPWVFPGKTPAGGELPNILPLTTQFYFDASQQYQLVATGPLAENFDTLGLPNPFPAWSVGQNNNIQLILPNANVSNLTAAATSIGDATLPGTGGTPCWTLNYGQNDCRVAILGTDPYNIPMTYPQPVYQMYFNAIKWTGHF